MYRLVTLWLACIAVLRDSASGKFLKACVMGRLFNFCYGPIMSPGTTSWRAWPKVERKNFTAIRRH